MMNSYRISTFKYHAEVLPYMPSMFKDDLYLLCIELAMRSKGEERYGSLLVREDTIIGRGYNRAIAHPSIGRLEREIRQGMANHAEIEAINDALSAKRDPEGSELYVAGYFAPGKLFFKTQYTCTKCIKHIKALGIESIYVPTPDAWMKKSIDVAAQEAQQFMHGTHQKRVDATIGDYTISDISIFSRRCV